jgi:hypothetical protein
MLPPSDTAGMRKMADIEKGLIDRAIEAVFASEILPCERGLNLNYDIAVIGCECYSELSTVDVRKLVTLVLSAER